MNHIFISYSHFDTEYAHKLAKILEDKGINVWIDVRLDVGTTWPHEIESQLDSCSAFILIMSPRSFVSDWVQNELQRAKRLSKPIFPFLLEGNGPWLSVESTQYYDVRSGQLPDARFFSALNKFLTPDASDQTPKPAPLPDVRKSPAKPTRPNRIGLFAGIFSVVALLCIAATLIWQFLPFGETPTPTREIVQTEPAPSIDGTEPATEPVSSPTSPATFTPSIPSEPITINQTQFAQGESKIEMIVESVEILPDSTMRWNFTFWNKSASNAQIGFDYARVYLADEFGNRYEVLGDSKSSNPAGGYIEPLAVGLKYEHWILFPAPKDGARKFTVGVITPANCCYAQWNLFTVNLDYTPPVVVEDTPSPSGTGIEVINIDQTQYGDDPKVEMTVRSVEILPDNTMKVNFSFWNKSTTNVQIGFDYARTYLADEFGNRYEVLGDGLSNNPAGGYVVVVQVGVKIDHTVIFPAPKNDAKRFTLAVLTPRNCCYVQWNLFSLLLEYDPQFSVTYTPTPSLSGAESIEINQTQYGDNSDVELTVRSVNLLSDGSIKLNLSFWNKSTTSVQIGFDYATTYLADEAGNQYQVVSDSLSSNPAGTLIFQLQVGVRTDHSVTFTPRQADAKTFTVAIITPRNCCYVQWNTFILSLE